MTPPPLPLDLEALQRLAADVVARREVTAASALLYRATGAAEDGLVYAVQTRQQAERAWADAMTPDTLLALLSALGAWREEIEKYRLNEFENLKRAVQAGDLAAQSQARGELVTLGWALARFDARVRLPEKET